MAKSNSTTPTFWGNALPLASLALLGCMEWLNARLALETASDQYDALGRVAINTVVGLTAFGGFVVANHLLADTRKGVRAQGRLAMCVAVLALGWTMVQGASYLAYHRDQAEAQTVAASKEYADAVKDKDLYRGMIARQVPLDDVQWEALKKAEAVVSAGDKPAVAKPQLQDFVRSGLIYLLTFGGVAFKLPAAKQVRRKAKRAKSNVTPLRSVG